MVGFKGWTNENAARLEEACAAAASADRGVAVFDFDNTCIVGDVGELFSYYLTDEMYYRWDLEEFWALIDERDGRSVIRQHVEQLLDMPEEVRFDHPVYQQYRAELGAVYQRILAREGARHTYAWAPRVHVGISEGDMSVMSRQCFARELASELHTESLEAADGERVEVSRGIRLIREIRDAMREFERRGVEVWIVSATNWWTVSACAPYFGVRPERVIGNRVEVKDRSLLTELVEPALYREGKVAAIEREIGQRPAVVFGDSETDEDMMEWASELAVVIDAGRKEFVERARERGWAIERQDALTWVQEFE